MVSEHDSRAHSSHRESKRRRDRFTSLFKSKESTIRTNTDSPTPESEHSSKDDVKPSTSNSDKSRQVPLNNQNPNLGVDQTQTLPKIGDQSDHGTNNDGDGIQSQSLWMRACKALEDRNSDLVAAYACHLDPDRNSSTTPTALSPELIEAVIDKKLQDNKAKNFVFHLGSKSIQVREQGEKIIKFIFWSNDFISTAVSAQPYAALAWSGVSILLPLLLNSSKQKEALLEGLNTITNLLRLYRIREELYLQPVDKPARPDFVNAVVKLYTDILEYQATLILHLSRSSVGRAIQSTFERNDWIGMLEKVESSNAMCTEYITLFVQDQELQFYKEQSSQIEQSREFQKSIIEMFKEFHKERQQDRQDLNKAGLFQTLASNYKSDKNSIPAWVSGTCKWVFEDKIFLEWRDNKNSAVIWISAGPGRGKSVLSRCLIDEKRLCTNVMTSTVCYFFFKDGDEQRTRGSNALSAILHQLFENKYDSSLLTYALSSYDRYGAKLQSEFSELWDVLIKSAKDPDAGEIICVLDALDECEKNDRKLLVQKLVDLQKDHFDDPSLKLKFLITSRPYGDLETGFRPISSMDTFARLDGDVKTEKIGQDICLVIDAKVPLIAGDFSIEDQKRISDHLKGLDNRSYLWLYLTIKIIEEFPGNYSKKSVLDKLLSGLPSSVYEQYEKILNRSSDKETARILLQIIIAARRPLFLDEMNIALSIATQRESCESYKTLELWPATSFKSTIQNMCGLFISVHDSRIFLIHQTAREVLTLSRSNLQDPSLREWGGSLNVTMAHGILSRVCLHYLNFQEFASVPQHRKNAQRNRNIYNFLDYAAREWPVHYTSQESELAKSSRKAAGMLCRPSLNQLSYWGPIYHKSTYKNRDFLVNRTELGIAARLGLSYVVEDLLKEKIDVSISNGIPGLDGKALAYASAAGHERIVEMLLNEHAHVNVTSEYYGPALSRASAAGHERIVEMLLNRHADVNATNADYGIALRVASAKGYERIVEMLLDQGADVNIESSNGTALRAASANGHERIVEMLLDQGADVNIESSIGTALRAASVEGYERIVEMLLDQHADVNIESGKGTALMVASNYGRERIVEMLLNQHADVNIESGKGTALMVASNYGRERIVEMLLNQHADVNIESEYLDTALITASANGYERIVEMLLDQGADVNIESSDVTALIAASAEGYEKIVEMLLKQHADVNIECEKRTALMAASAQGCERIVEMLLNQHANVDAQGRVDGRNGDTALILASSRGHERIVEMLLNQRANVNATNGYHGTGVTALSAASAKGHERIVEMLLNKHANVNATSGYYGTALTVASAKGHERIIEMLLNQHADVNATSGYHGTALTVASAKGHARIVEMLLNQHADVNATSGYHGTALTVASARGDERIVRMLLDEHANVNMTGRRGTALIAASSGGHEKIVEMLLKQHADVNTKGGDYDTALIEAAASGHEKVVEMLLNQHADVNAEGRYHATALTAASGGGHVKMVEILLDKNPAAYEDVALERALAAGQKEVIEVLLKRDPDIDFKGETYRNALEKASREFHIRSVDMVLNKMIAGNVEFEVYDNALEVALSAAIMAAAQEDELDDDDDDDDGDNKDKIEKYNRQDAMIEMLKARKRNSR